MADDDRDQRRIIIDRANRMMKQSRTLRRLANELQQESRDIRGSAKRKTTKTSAGRKLKR